MKIHHLVHWFVSRSKVTKVGLMLVATFLIFGGLGLAMRPTEHKAAVQGANILKSSAADKTTVTEKSKVDVDTTKIETTEEEIPFTTTQTYDGTLPKDSIVVRVEGSAGKKIVKTEVKWSGGSEISRALISESITVPPVTKVIAIGTKIVSKPGSDKPKKCEKPDPAPMCTSDPAEDTACASTNCNDNNQESQ